MKYPAAVLLLLFVALGFNDVFGAETITLKVPGGEMRGTIEKIDEKSVVMKLTNGTIQAIPISFLSKEQLAMCQKSLVDPTDAAAMFKLAEEMYLKGNKKQAYELFQQLTTLDSSFRSRISDLIAGKVTNTKPQITSSKAAQKQEPLTLSHFDEAHTEIYYRYSTAIVGLNCKVKSNANLRYMGTGAVISPDGLILTSTTVIPADAHEIRVNFCDGHIRTGELVHFDKDSEGVLVKLAQPQANLTFMNLADSDQFRPGDPVYSWGNPYNTIAIDGTVSLSLGQISGIYNVSSVDDESRYIGPVIETDAAVNPGSDGGPLTDVRGNLLGIMSLAFTPTRWQGLVIPTRRLLAGIPELKSLKLASKAEWTAQEAGVWARQVALQAAADKVEHAVLGIWVVHDSDKVEPPLDRESQVLKEQPVIPRQLRAQAERNLMQERFSSGFIVESSGTVITAARNLDPRRRQDPKNPRKTFESKIQRIWGYLHDGRRVELKLLGQNGTYDLAVLQIVADGNSNWPSIELGNNTILAQGAAVALLGRSEPPGKVTLNAGSISAIHRVSKLCAQISCLMNYGNLGGPVVNIHGQVIGMASHLHPQTMWRQSCGVGFCLLSEQILKVLPDLKAGKTIAAPKRAYIGVTPDLTANTVNGVLINAVEPGSPAERAGLQPGDIVTSIAGEIVENGVALHQAIRSLEIGQEFTIGILRNNVPMELKITIGTPK